MKWLKDILQWLWFQLPHLQHALHHGFTGGHDTVTFAPQLEVECLCEGGEEGEEEVVVQTLPGMAARHVQPHVWRTGQRFVKE